MATRRKVLREGTRKKIEYFDYNLLAVLIFIICFGLIMLYLSLIHICIIIRWSHWWIWMKKLVGQREAREME